MLAATLFIAAPSIPAQGAAPVTTATADGASPRLRCYRGRPLPACQTFVITELGVYPNLASTTSTPERFPGDRASGQVEDFGDHAMLELGMMRNRGQNSAIGATVVFGVDANGTRYGAKVRYRRWLEANGLSFDASGGVVSGTFREFNRTAVLTGDVALNFSDYGALLTRVELARAQGRTPAALYGGARLGSKPGLIATGLSVLATIAFAIVLAAAWGDT